MSMTRFVFSVLPGIVAAVVLVTLGIRALMTSEFPDYQELNFWLLIMLLSDLNWSYKCLG